MKRKTPGRVKPKPLTTAAGFVRWIARNVPQHKRPDQSALQAACWYWAVQEAETLAEETVRHVAQHLMTPHPGYSTLAHIQEQLDGLDDEDDFDIEEAMCAFWGVVPK